MTLIYQESKIDRVANDKLNWLTDSKDNKAVADDQEDCAKVTIPNAKMNKPATAATTNTIIAAITSEGGTRESFPALGEVTFFVLIINSIASCLH